MAIYDVRRANAQALVKECGSQARLAMQLGASRQQVNHIVGPRHVKHIGDELARKIEQRFNRPYGWLDEDHTAPVPRRVDVHSASMPKLNYRVVGGDHFKAPPEGDQPEITLPRSWISGRIGSSNINDLAVTVVEGDSMDPTLPDGSLLLVDRSASAASVDGVFVLATQRNSFVRRVQRKLDGSYVIKCDNPGYPQESVSATKELGAILGRGILALVPRKL